MSGFANNPIVAFNDGPLFYILCGVFNGIFVIDIVLFIHMSRTEAALRVRGLFLSITHVLAGIVYTTNTFINLPVRPYYSCPLYFSMASIGLAAWATSLGLRFWRLMWLAEFNRELFEKERKRRLEIRHGSVAAIRGSNPEVLPLQIAPGHPPNILNVGNPPQVIQNIRYQNPACATRFGTMCVTTADSSPISLNRGTPHATALVPIHETNEGHSLSTLDVSQPTRPWWDVLLRRRRAQEITATILTHPPTDTKNMFTRVIHYLAKIRILQPQFHEHVFFIIVFLATIAVVMAILLHPLFAQGKDSILRNCRATWPFDMLNAGQGSFFLVIFPLITIIVWNTTNIYGIRNEVLIQCLLGCVCMTTFLLLRYVSGPGWARARANFPIEMVLTILIIFSHIMSIVWPMVYIKYERRALRKHRKKASKILCDILTKSTSENINEFEAFLDALDYPEIKVALHRYSVHDFTVENLAFAGRLRYLDQILRRGRPEDYAPYYRTLYRHTDGIPLPVEGRILTHPNMNVPVGRHTPPESSAMGARDSNEEIREEGEEEEVEEPPIPPMCDKAKEVLKRELNSLYEEFIGSSAPNEINLTADCRKRLDQAYKENRLSFEDFEPARYEVLQLIFQNTWPRMLRSQLR